MSSAALKIVMGIKESAAATWERDKQDAIDNGWKTECLKSMAEVEHLKFQIKSIQSRIILECGYFIRGECHRKHCICAETCRVD